LFEPVVIQLLYGVQITLINNLKHHFATLATKAFFICNDRPAATFFPAMVTNALCIGSLFQHNCFSFCYRSQLAINKSKNQEPGQS
jgi:hypothetical protein